MKTIARFAAYHPVWAIILTIAIVGGLGAGLPWIEVDPDIENMLPDDLPASIYTEQVEEYFGSSDVVLIALMVDEEYDSIYHPDILKIGYEINERLNDAPYVQETMSLFEAQDIYVETDELTGYDTLYTSDLIEISSKEEVEDLDLDHIRERVQANETISEMIVSKDEKAMLIVGLIRESVPMSSWLRYIGLDDKLEEHGIEYSNDAEHILLDSDINAFKPSLPKELNIPENIELDLNAFIQENPASLMRIEEEFNTLDEEGKPTGAIKTYIMGTPYVRYYNAQNISHDMRVFLIIGISIMLIFLFISFRTIRGVLLPFSVVGMSIIATIGFMGWVGAKIYVMSTLIFPMLIAIANDYGIHIVARYYEDVKEFFGIKSKKEISENGVLSMGFPILIAGFTTIIGMLTLLTHRVEPAQMIGLFTGFGIFIALVLSLLFIPAMLSLLNVPKILQKKTHGQKLDQVLGYLSAFISKNRKWVLVAGAIFIAFFGSWIYFIEVDSDIFNFYKEDSKMILSKNQIGDKFGGAITMNLLLEADQENAFKEGPVLLKMEEIQNRIETITMPETDNPIVGEAVSIITFLQEMNEVQFHQYNENNSMHKIPDLEMLKELDMITEEELNSENAQEIINRKLRRLLSLYFFTYENTIDPGTKDNFIFLGYSREDKSYSKAQIQIRLPDISYSKLDYFLDVLYEYDEDPEKQGINLQTGDYQLDIHPAGFAMNMYHIPDLVTMSQVYSLIFSIVVIAILLMIVYRSVNAGLLSSVPLILALVSVFGVMAITGIYLDFFTAMLSSVLIGVGVDYTIHMIWRYREEAQKGEDEQKAFFIAATTVGKGILFNALSVVVGFIALFFSNFVPVIYFGFLITLSITTCLIGAFTLLPALIMTIKPKFLFNRKRETLIETVQK